MTVVTTRVPAVIDYLVALFTNAATIGAATPPVTVYDGPVTTGATPQLVLWVGMTDPDSPASPIAAESQQEWVGLGARQRNEYITVHCVAEAWAGGTDVATMRTNAYNIVAAVEALLQGDANLGGNVAFIDPTMPGRQLRQQNTSNGQVARVFFQIKAKARIGGSP